jgi:hypothetical protein
MTALSISLAVAAVIVPLHLAVTVYQIWKLKKGLRK